MREQSTPPNAADDAPGVGALLSQWRGRMLGPILLTSATIGTLTGAIYGYQHWIEGSWLPAAAGSVLVLLLWIAAGSARLSTRARIALTLLVTYASGLISLCTTGIGAAGLVGVFGYVSMAALLLGPRHAALASGVALVTLAACAAGYQTGLLQVLEPNVLDSANPWNWLRVTAFGAGIVAGVCGGSIFLLQELVKALEQRTELIAKLREEAQARERALAQLAETQERLLHAHKLEAVGRLAGGIAHDFNNTLTVILSYGELLKTRLGRSNPLTDLTDQIIQAAAQGGDLTKQLLTFTRRQAVKPSTVDVQQLLRNAERALARLVPKSIRVHRIESDDELFVTIDPTQLQQAILNLALNARDAMPEGGDLYLEASALELRGRSDVPLLSGPYVMVRVRDTGTGMSDELKARIFEPFFTTKEPGLGTGLGLSNVRDTTEAAGGHVSVESEIGRGSVLTLYFPRVEPRASGVEASPVARTVRQATLLVVDDEPQIREVIRTMLVDNGYVVIVADSAKSALSSLRREQVDLVCTDLVMPDMSGVKLIDELSHAHPHLPVIVCSAYGTDDDVSRRVRRGELLFLLKPFTRKDLLDAVERALGTQRNGGRNGKPLAAG